MPQEIRKYSNKISVEKFIFYWIISFGIYGTVWFYRNWEFFKEKDKVNISPFWRTFFAFFYLDQLFEIMLKLSQERGYKKMYPSGWLTIAFIILILSSRLPGPFWLISFFAFLPLLGPLKAINYYWDKNKKLPERTMELWHILLIILGIISLILVLVNTFFIFENVI